MRSRIGIGLLTLLLANSAHSELTLPALFSNGMVLQRDQPIPVWGWTDPEIEVMVSFGEQKVSTQADPEGKFRVRLKKMPASTEPRLLTVVTENDSAEVKNILVGEVWLCSGQSNMQWPVHRSNHFEKEKAAADHPLIRMFLTTQVTSQEALPDCSGSWTVCTPENVGQFSGVAYFFGRDLHQALEVPVGLIRSCWGGTRIESWISPASLQKFPDAIARMKQLDAEAEVYDQKEEDEKYTRLKAKWDKAKAEGIPLPRRPWPKSHPHKNQNYPGGLYNAMIHPLIPYSMRGAIWYQGESNAEPLNQAIKYGTLLETMVQEWRSKWDDEFPFYAVQLVNHMAPQKKPSETSGWVAIRERFLRFSKEIPNSGMAVGIDVGEAKNLHPPNKQAIGNRLAQQALAHTYDKEIVPGGPLYKSMKIQNNQIALTFDDIGSGLIEQDGEPLKTFAIAGADQRFVFAQAEIKGNTVVVHSDEIPDPVSVRYAWANNPVGCNLANKEGFPASPFRTDEWPLTNN